MRCWQICAAVGGAAPCGSTVTRNETSSKNRIKNGSLPGAVPQALLAVGLFWHTEPWIPEQGLALSLCVTRKGRWLTGGLNDNVQWGKSLPKRETSCWLLMSPLRCSVRASPGSRYPALWQSWAVSFLVSVCCVPLAGWNLKVVIGNTTLLQNGIF